MSIILFERASNTFISWRIKKPLVCFLAAKAKNKKCKEETEYLDEEDDVEKTSLEKVESIGGTSQIGCASVPDDIFRPEDGPFQRLFNLVVHQSRNFFHPFRIPVQTHSSDCNYRKRGRGRFRATSDFLESPGLHRRKFVRSNCSSRVGWRIHRLRPFVR